MSRTYLVVPAGDVDQLAKALSHGADALIVDLVRPSGGCDRDARANVASFLATATGAEIWLRVHPGPIGHEDIRELANLGTQDGLGGALRGVFVARTESPVQLDALDSVLSNVETELGLPSRSLVVVPSIESAGAVLAAPAIARAPRVAQLFLAEDELVAELDLTLSADERELWWIRSQIVVASAAAAIDAPIAGSATDGREIAAVRQSTLDLRRAGFGGRACADAEHVAIVDAVFQPSTQEVLNARDILDRWAVSKHDTSTVCRDAQGRTIDEARVRRAQRTVGRS